MTTLTIAAQDSTTMLRREFKHTIRFPLLLVGLILVPVVFLLLFVYILGGPIGHGLGTAARGAAYVDFLVPGILVMTVAGRGCHAGQEGRASPRARGGAEAFDDLDGFHIGRAGRAGRGSFLRRPPRHLLRPAGAARLAARGLVRARGGGRATAAGWGARGAADHRPRHLRDQRVRFVRGQRAVPPGPLDRVGPTADAAPGPHDDLLSHCGHGHPGAAADLVRDVRAGLPDHGVDPGRHRGCGPHEMDERARTAGRHGLCRGWAGSPPWRCRACGSTPAWRQPRWCSRAACSTPPGPSATVAAGPIRARPCSATTRSSTPSSASPRRASTSRSPS